MDTKHYDVVIVGAGVGGVSTAISAARHGAKTLLIEAGACPGGMGTAGLVPFFVPFSYKPEPIVGGLMREIHQRLIDLGGSNDASWATVDAELFKYLCDEMMEEAGVTVKYLTTLREVSRTGRRIESISVCDRSLKSSYSADNFIDATGDAALAYMTGIPVKCGDKDRQMQAGSVCFVAAGIKPELLEDTPELHESHSDISYLTNEMRKWCKEWEASGELKNSKEFEFHIAGASIDMKRGILRCNFGHFYGFDFTNGDHLSYILREGRKKVVEFVDCMKRNIPAMRDAIVLATPSLPDVRESRRIVGKYVLEDNAFWNGERHEDDIAIADYMIDLHALTLEESIRGGNAITEELLDTSINKFYGVPFSIMLTNEVDNLGVVGRCVSASRGMLGALRVMPIVIAMGQALGTAAALSNPVANVNIPELQKILLQEGAILDYAGTPRKC